MPPEDFSKTKVLREIFANSNTGLFKNSLQTVYEFRRSDRDGHNKA
jgi:hypothetical protein